MKSGHMKYILIFILSLALSACQATSSTETNSTPTQEWIIEDLVKKWEHNKKYTIMVLERMPEEAYDFVPAEGMRSFREQATHIIQSFVYQLGKTEIGEFLEIDGATREAMVASYERVFDHVLNYIKQCDGKLGNEVSMWYGSSSHLRLFNLMDNHLAHHRGQMIVYLRLKGIKPPQYVGW